MFFEADVNYLAVALGALAAQPLGYLWYSPQGFGSRWMKLSKLTQRDLQGGGNTPYLVGVVAAVLIAYGLARVVDWAAADNVLECIAVAAFAWSVFAGTVMAVGRAYSKTPSVELFAIEGGYQLASFVIMGAILGAFQ